MGKNYKSYLNTNNRMFCCSCRACENICPVSCISMIKEEGFIYPHIDKNKCIHCDMCEKVCQYNNTFTSADGSFTQKVYAGWNREVKKVKESTSGAIFSALSDYILENGGTVYGAVFDEKFNVVIKKTDSFAGRDQMRGSKYVWSDTNSTYRQVKEDLETGKNVLYSGVPCQVSGLRNFLQKNYKNLYCVDLVCHGFPSGEVWSKYVDYLEHKYHAKLVKFEFRHKSKENLHSVYRAEMDNSHVLMQSLSANAYSRTYNSLISHMLSCYNCMYTKKERTGDITLGDFWGIEHISPQNKNALGTSLIMVNSEKGELLLDKINNAIVISKRTIEEAQIKNPALREPVKKHPWRRGFFKSLDKYGFMRTFNIYIRVGNVFLIPYRILRKIKFMIGDKT